MKIKTNRAHPTAIASRRWLSFFSIYEGAGISRSVFDENRCRKNPKTKLKKKKKKLKINKKYILKYTFLFLLLSTIPS